ncbi:serine/threonine-protein kinase [Spirillospora sp. CA-294931]|uniref:serine/threonine-protein kinase n=1 Tax=Spirillospora sp. CA-294931 TaxID=3240042 RepID=UPI003D924362
MLDRAHSPFVGHDTGVSFPPTVGRYRIDHVLGSGAFASVWLGHDDALDSHVAIKVLSGSLIDDLDVRNRFLEEARILRRADSERLVRVHDIGELPDGRPYFVMSHADRGTLADRMRERPLPVSEALVYAEEIAYGVEVINTLGVIHRDLKPSNVLFQSTPDGGEKLLIADLGLAKALAHASGAFTLPVGTPGYMSPEQARFGGGLDVRADVYGLGALTYHMLTGRPPGPAPVKVAPSRLREGLNPAFDQVILRALEVEREKRWATAEAFAEALSTLRPTLAPGFAQAPVSDLESTVRDRPSSGGQAPSAPLPAPPMPPEPEPSTREDSSPSYRNPPPSRHPNQPPPQYGPPPGEPATVVDQPSDSGSYQHRQAPQTPQAPDDRTISIPAPQQYAAPPVPPENGATAVFSPQAPQQQPHGQQPPHNQGPPNQSPHYQGMPQQGAPYPGPQGPPPTHTTGPRGQMQQGQQGQPPTGFSPAPQGGGGGGPFAKLKGLGRSKGSGPGAPGGKKSMAPLLIGVGLLTLALIGGLFLGAVLSGDDKKKQDPKKQALPADFVKVQESSRKISTAVPKVWPLVTQEPTWRPPSVGLADPQPRPVLRATTNLADNKGDGRTPGVFIGLTSDIASGKLPPPSATAHASCTKGTPEKYTTPDKALTGTVTRYTGCKSGTATVTEVGLVDQTRKLGVWMRVKESDNRNVTRTILDNLKITSL